MCIILFFFFNDTATTEIYTLSLHDALPILARGLDVGREQRSLHCIVFEDEDRGQGRGTDEGAPTVLRGDQALLFELVQGLTQGEQGDAQGRCQVGLRREPPARWQEAGGGAVVLRGGSGVAPRGARPSTSP